MTRADADQGEWGRADSWLPTSAVPVGPRLALTLLAVTAIGLLAFTWPLFVDSGAAVLASPTGHSATAPLILGVVLALALVVTLMAISDGGMDVRAVALLGLLSAVGALIRPIAAGTGGVETVFILLVLGGRVFGPGFGFLLGVSTLFSSALLTGGVGPWLPFQMLAAGWVGLGAGLLPRRVGTRGTRGSRVGELALLATYGAVSSVAFGVLLNLSFWPFVAGMGTEISFVPGDPLGANLARFASYSIITSLPWDLTRALTTAAGVLVLGHPVLVTLRRAAKRAVFVDPPRSPGDPAAAQRSSTT